METNFVELFGERDKLLSIFIDDGSIIKLIDLIYEEER